MSKHEVKSQNFELKPYGVFLDHDVFFFLRFLVLLKNVFMSQAWDCTARILALGVFIQTSLCFFNKIFNMLAFLFFAPCCEIIFCSSNELPIPLAR